MSSTQQMRSNEPLTGQHHHKTHKDSTALAGPLDAPHGVAFQVPLTSNAPLSTHEHFDVTQTGPATVHVEESHSIRPTEGLETTVPVERIEKTMYHSVKPSTLGGSNIATPSTYSAIYKANPEQFRRKAPVEVEKPASGTTISATSEHIATPTTTEKKLSRKERKMQAKKEKKLKAAAAKKEKQEKKIKTKTHKVKAPGTHEHPVAEAIKEETKNALKEAVVTGTKVALGAVVRGGIRIVASSFSGPPEEKVVEKVEMVKTAEGTTEEHVLTREHPAPIEHMLARGAHGVHKYASRFGHNLARQMRKVEILVEREDGRRIDLIREMSMKVFLTEGRVQSKSPEDMTSIEDIALAVHEMSDLVAAKASRVRDRLVAQEEKIKERERMARETGDDVIHLTKSKVLRTVGLSGKKTSTTTTTTGSSSSAAMATDHLSLLRGLEDSEAKA